MHRNLAISAIELLSPRPNSSSWIHFSTSLPLPFPPSSPILLPRLQLMHMPLSRQLHRRRPIHRLRRMLIRIKARIWMRELARVRRETLRRQHRRRAADAVRLPGVFLLLREVGRGLQWRSGGEGVGGLLDLGRLRAAFAAEEDDEDEGCESEDEDGDASADAGFCADGEAFWAWGLLGCGVAVACCVGGW